MPQILADENRYLGGERIESVWQLDYGGVSNLIHRTELTLARSTAGLYRPATRQNSNAGDDRRESIR
jgi:hypothetical protein